MRGQAGFWDIDERYRRLTDIPRMNPYRDLRLHCFGFPSKAVAVEGVKVLCMSQKRPAARPQVSIWW